MTASHVSEPSLKNRVETMAVDDEEAAAQASSPEALEGQEEDFAGVATCEPTDSGEFSRVEAATDSEHAALPQSRDDETIITITVGAVQVQEEARASKPLGPCWKRTSFLLWATIILVCLVAVGVGVGVALGTSKDDSTDPEDDSLTPPHPRDPTLLREIRAIFQQQDWSLSTAWLDPTSPQSRALDEITQEFYDLYHVSYVTDPTAPEATDLLASELNGTTDTPTKWQQRYALWVVAFATSMATQNIPLDECSWHGPVECSADGAVITSVNFDQMNLRGSLPAEVSLWTELEAFSAASNSLEEDLPPSMYRMSNLRVIELPKNRLAFALPSNIGWLSTLEILDLDFNFITGPLPPAMMNLTKLKQLRLEDSMGISGPIFDFMLSWPDIEVVHIGSGLTESAVTGTIPTNLPSLSRLRWLDILNSAIHGTIPTELGEMSQLERLSIGNVQGEKKITGSLPSQLGDNCQNKLASLLITSSDITGTLPPSLGNCTKLRRLGVFETGVNGTIPDSYRTLTNVENIFLDDNSLSGKIPAWLGEFEKLVTLLLSGNSFENEAVPEELCGIQTLIYDCSMTCSCCLAACAG